MTRQQVHLASTPDEATAVGRHHADEPVVLVIDAQALTQDGFEIKKRGTATFPVDHVPPEYIDRSDTGDR